MDRHRHRTGAERVHRTDGQVHGNRLEGVHARGGGRRGERYVGLRRTERRHRSVGVPCRVRVRILRAVLPDRIR